MADYTYAEEYTFSDAQSAKHVLDELCRVAEHDGYVTEDYFLDLMEINHDYDPDCRIREERIGTIIGWLKEDIRKAHISVTSNIHCEYCITLDWPRDITSAVIQIWAEINNKKNIKEENTMKPNYNTGSIPTTINPYEDSEDIAYDQKVKALQDEAEQKIFDIRRELAHALETLRVERNEKNNKERERRMAKAWKTKYDALVEAGFTAEQAWEMTMKSFELD